MAARDGEQVEAGEWKSVNLEEVGIFLRTLNLVGTSRAVQTVKIIRDNQVCRI